MADLYNPSLTTGVAKVFNVKDYGAKGDGKSVSDAAITTGTAILTSSTAGFTSGDVGKIVTVVGAGASAALLYTTILSYQSATQVTLSANAGTTVSSASVTYGTDDSTAIQNAINACSLVGGTVYIPSSVYVINNFLTIKSGISIKGDGQAKTVLFNTQVTFQTFRHVDNTGGITDVNLYDLGCTCPSNGSPFWYSRGNMVRVKFYNCTFNAPGLGASGFLVFFDAYTPNQYCEYVSCTFNGLTVGFDMLGGGLQNSTVEKCLFSNGNGQGTANTGATNCKYIGNTFISVGNPISLEGTTSGNTFYGNLAYYSGLFKMGLPSNATDNASNSSIINNKSFYCVGGIQLGNSLNMVVQENLIYRAQKWGIYGNVSNSLIKDNILYQNNWSNNSQVIGAISTGTGGIQVLNTPNFTSQAPTRENSISGNLLYSDNATWVHPTLGTNQTDFSGGIGIDNQYLTTIVTGNKLHIAFHNEIVDTGSGTVAFQNPGANEQPTYTVAVTLPSYIRIARTDATTAAFTVTLPDATTCSGRLYVIKKIDATANAVTVATTSSQTIDGTTTRVLSAQYNLLRFQSNGTNWDLL